MTASKRSAVRRRDERAQDRRNRADRGRHPGAGVRGFSYTQETHEAKIGSLELSVSDKETVNVPGWVGVGAIVVGGFLLLVPRKGLAAA